MLKHSNLAEEQMRLAMEEMKERKVRMLKLIELPTMAVPAY